MNTKTSKLNLNWPSLLVLVRHGESEGNKHTSQYMTEVVKKPSHKFELTEVGQEQAKQAGVFIEERFGRDGFDAYFTSTYTRAQQTFDGIFSGVKKNGHSIEAIMDARVTEISRGYGNRISKARLAANHPEEIIGLDLNGWFHNIPLGGQSCVQMDHVIHSFLAFLRETCADKRVILVGHGTWINLCCRILTNRSMDDAEARHDTQFYTNCGVTVFEKNPEGELCLVGENINV